MTSVLTTWPITARMIQVGRRGETRPPHRREAHALVLGALATLSDMAGVNVGNMTLDGKPVAVAILDGSRFEQDSQGGTRLAVQNDEEL